MRGIMTEPRLRVAEVQAGAACAASDSAGRRRRTHARARARSVREKLCQQFAPFSAHTSLRARYAR